MFKKCLSSLVAVCLVFIGMSAPANGGGWAVLTLDEWPTQVVANQPITIGFTLRQHGQTLLSGLGGSVVFEGYGKVGARPLQFRVNATRAEGHYTATITLPTAGVWQWRIEIFGEHPMPALTVLATDSAQLFGFGRDLFVAKGCAMCHAHAAISRSGEFQYSYGVGGAPTLADRLLAASYVRAWLKDPKAVKPTTLMPNLNLKPNEIEALVVFLKAK